MRGQKVKLLNPKNQKMVIELIIGLTALILSFGYMMKMTTKLVKAIKK